MSSRVNKVTKDAEFASKFESATKKNNATSVTVLYFTASWCGPCQQISPLYDNLSSQYPNANLLKIDVDQCPETSSNYGISGMPTFIFFVGSTRVHEFSGADSNQLSSKLAELSANSGDSLGQGWDIQKFQDVCNCSEQEARHYLNAYANDMEAAITGYLSESGGPNVDMDEFQSASSQVQPPPLSANSSASNSKPKIATISTNKIQDDDKDGQAFYVGGSEGGGGQQVLGPKRDKSGSSNNEELVTKLFEKARKGGAEQMDTTRVEDPSKPRIKAFTGTAHRLGSDLAQPSNMVQGSSTSDKPIKPTIIKMWNNGFSLDDGPLREFNDPASREFLDSIQRGEVPRELQKSVQNGEANVLMEDHRNEEYKAPPKPKVVPFSGAGNMLGAPTPQVVSAGTTVPVTTEPAPEVDKSKPLTKLQIRLSDGSRLVVELNHSHTIADIRKAILSQKPSYTGTNFILMTTFPNKELTDESVSIEEAKLLGSALVQKLK